MAGLFGKLLVTKPPVSQEKPAMHLECVTFYRVCDAYLQQIGFVDDPQAKMTTTEVLLTALGTAWFFGNNLRLACQALKESGRVVYMLSESRFNRGWHK